MFGLVITVDYELAQNVYPDVRKYLIEPTNTLLDVCEAFGAKLTIMVEVGEQWAFEKDENISFKGYIGYDPSEEIKNQFVQAIKLGHDVQLHLHPQWLNAKWSGNEWKLDYSRYRLPLFDYHEMVEVLRRGKQYLERLLRPYNEDYACIGFRSGNWNTQPSEKYLRALKEAGIESDTSVFKWGYIDNSSVYLDYREAYSNLLPWFASWTDINRPSEGHGILEMPIYAEPVSIFGLLSLKRLKMAPQYYFEDRTILRKERAANPISNERKASIWSSLSKIFRVYSKKLDFCKLTKREMLQMVENIIKQYRTKSITDLIPITMIGHSKEVRSCSQFGRFLKQINEKYNDIIYFSTYREIINRYLRMPRIVAMSPSPDAASRMDLINRC